MATYNKETGAVITGLEEVFQGIETILMTPKRSRVMRRDFGSDLPRFVDRGLSPVTVIDFFQAIAEAIRGEPRFALARSGLSPNSSIEEGNPIFDLYGIYYPRGHLNDFTEAVTITGRSVTVSDRAI